MHDFSLCCVFGAGNFRCHLSLPLCAWSEVCFLQNILLRVTYMVRLVIRQVYFQLHAPAIKMLIHLKRRFLCTVWWIQPPVSCFHEAVMKDSFLYAHHTPNNLASWKGRVADDLFQTFNNPLTQLDQHT